MVRKDRTIGGGGRCRRLVGAMAVLGLLVSQSPSLVLAGPYDPGRLRAIARGGVVSISHREVAAAVRLRLPFQAVRSGETALVETRLSVGLALRRMPPIGVRPGLPAVGWQRPLMRLSFDFTGRVDALRFNGLPLATPTILAAAEDATTHEDVARKKHKNRKWWWIGGGAALIGLAVAVGLAVDSAANQPFDFKSPGQS